MPPTSARLYWKPTPEYISATQHDDFRRYVNKRYGKNFALTDYDALHRWSVDSDSLNDFWTSIWDWSGIIGNKDPAGLFRPQGLMSDPRNPFGSTKINWAENILLSHSSARSSKITAVVSLIEPPKGGNAAVQTARYTFDELYDQVKFAAAGLKKLGVGPGDRVAAVTSNNAEAIVMVLATSSLGASWSCTSPELGDTAILERFTQFKPKVLLTVDRYRVMGNEVSVIDKIERISETLADYGLETIVLVGQLEMDRRSRSSLSLKRVKSIDYVDLLDKNAETLSFHRGSAYDPLWVLFSSGTTGIPKAIIHAQCGLVLDLKKAGLIHGNHKAGDLNLQFTTCGWMMWNSMVQGIGLGAGAIAYDGSPFYPHAKVLWDVVENYKVTSFGLGPRYLQVLQQSGIVIKNTHRLEKLRSILSTGSPMSAELYTFVKDTIKHVFIQNTSGGTDICGGLVGGCHALPVYTGAIQVPVLGIALECWDENGNRLPDGEQGDLVVTQRFPNQPLGLLGDDAKRSRLVSTYYDHFKNAVVWYQGDHIEIDSATKGIIMQGRSDGVLNPQGVRFGSAEVYAVLEPLREKIEDSIVVGLKTQDGDERVILFVKPKHGDLTPSIVKNIQDTIRTQLSKRHVPAKIIACPEIPYTSTGKRLEVALKKVINGTHPSKVSTTAMVNADCMKWFYQLPELEDLRGTPPAPKVAVRSKL